MPFSHSTPAMAGTSRAREAPRMRVIVWHVISKAMSCRAANLVNVAIMALMTAYLRPAAHFDWSVLFFARSSVLRGYALSMRVERESITTRLAFGWGKDAGGCMNRASTCASVGAARRWKRLCRASGEGSEKPSGFGSISRRRWATRGAHAASEACQRSTWRRHQICPYRSSTHAAPRPKRERPLAAAARSFPLQRARTPPSPFLAHIRRRRRVLAGWAGQAAGRAG